MTSSPVVRFEDVSYGYPNGSPVLGGLTLSIDPGDVVVVETEDAFGGVITSERDSPTAKLQFPFLNPQCGPIAVSGVEKGPLGLSADARFKIAAIGAELNIARLSLSGNYSEVCP